MKSPSAARLRTSIGLLASGVFFQALPAVADLRLQLLEGGGNAAAYGEMIVFSEGQGRVAAVPVNAFTGDNCVDRPGSGFGALETTWNLGDTPLGTLLHARVTPVTAYSSRCSCAPGTCPLYPACTVRFTGWSGECSGLGTRIESPIVEYDCTFPWDGDASLTATFQFEDNQLGTGDSCVPVDAPTTTTLSSPPTTTTLFVPDPVSMAIDDLVDQLLPPIIIKGIAGLGLDLVMRGNGLPRGRYRAEMTMAAGGRAKPSQAGVTVIAKGGTRVGRNGQLTLKLKPTRRARKLSNSATPLAIDIAVRARAAGKTYTASRSVVVGP